MPFSQLGLSNQIVEGVKAMGYVDPTPIQLRTVPLILEGRDVIGSAQTGTGKTAAFAMPILTQLNSHQKEPRVLVLEPTRELAAQVETAFRDHARFTDLRVAALYGGVGYGRQIEALKRGLDVIVATPGRLLDHLQQRNCRLQAVQFLVLDEADRMLDMGFLPDVRKIIDRCPRKRQTALFSATIPPEIETLIQWAMQNPETIEIGARRSPAETVKHVIYPVAEAQKTDLLLALMERVTAQACYGDGDVHRAATGHRVGDEVDERLAAADDHRTSLTHPPRRVERDVQLGSSAVGASSSAISSTSSGTARRPVAA